MDLEENEQIFEVIGGYFCGSKLAFKNAQNLNGQFMTIGFENVEHRPGVVYHFYKIDDSRLLYCGESPTPITTLKQ